jgi:hypothetical protein
MLYFKQNNYKLGLRKGKLRVIEGRKAMHPMSGMAGCRFS